ncbi:unnamed protein product [Trifolium pratense]|uniref:Uncharacterized protein n=1 Tax=Trifolium pratense TaxID=57577 RepID=A0ACB0M959_TRIPR|nr:unnamed protein product [Trifolium pratense]
MNVLATNDDDQYMQFYYHNQQPFMDINMEGFSNTTMVTTSPTMSSNDIFLTQNDQLAPKNNNTFKPTRKRSRASKKTPITLLNANTNNFRTLVQQFTGCPTTTSTAMSFSTHKGPITLNFQQAHHHHQVTLPQQQKVIPKQKLMQNQHQSQSSFLPTSMEGSDYGLPMNNNDNDLFMNALSNFLFM